MSKTRMMSKQQRLYYEQNKKLKVQEEISDLAKQTREHEHLTVSTSTFNPHQLSYYS